MRHGEAGFLKPRDFDRILTKKGILSVQRTGKALEKSDIRLDFAFCSPSKKTRQTLQFLRKFRRIEEYVFDEEIYFGKCEELIKIINKTPFLANSCILIGHNPSISALLSTLTQQEFLTLEPGMLVQLSLYVSDWSLVGTGTASVSAFW